MDGQAGPPALGDMLRQIHDDLGALPKGRLEVPVQVGPIQVVFGDRRADHPEWKVDILSPEASKPVLANYKLQFGPAILVNERMEFVGVPRYRMLVERIAMVGAGRISPRTAQPPTPATPTSAGAAKPAAPAKPPAAPETKPSP